MKPHTITLVAVLCVAVTGCISATDPNRKTKQGAGVGAGAGAVVGAVVGHQSGNKERGAVIGAAVGAGVGGVVGRRMDKQQAELERVEGLEVARTATDEIAVTIRGDILYDTDSWALRPSSEAALAEMSGVLAGYADTRIEVSGHADSTGSERHNQELSTRRAQSVSSYFSSRGVAASRIESFGYGESSPRESNETAEGRQLNRRVEIRIKAEQP